MNSLTQNVVLFWCPLPLCGSSCRATCPPIVQCCTLEETFSTISHSTNLAKKKKQFNNLNFYPWGGRVLGKFSVTVSERVLVLSLSIFEQKSKPAYPNSNKLTIFSKFSTRMHHIYHSKNVC